MWEPRTLRGLQQCDADLVQLRQARPLPVPILQKIRAQLRVVLTYASNAIEGNTLTLQETQAVLEGQTIGGKPVRDTLEALDHAEAFDFLWDLAQARTPLTLVDIRSLHHLVLQRSYPDMAGRFRTTGVHITGSSHLPPDPASVPADMDAWVGQWHADTDTHPLVRAAQLHSAFVTIHPFGDGNGRTARLLTHLDLLRHDYRPALLRPADRFAYYDALEAARVHRWDPLVRHLAAGVHRAFRTYWAPYLLPPTLSPSPDAWP